MALNYIVQAPFMVWHHMPALHIVGLAPMAILELHMQAALVWPSAHIMLLCIMWWLFIGAIA